MKSFKEFLTENYRLVYHVTSAAKVPKIQVQGLRPMQTSNWLVAGTKERYGRGEIFAFENLKDAYRWAAKMDWEFNKEVGSGKIAILTIQDEGDWEEDTAGSDEQSGSEGKWLKTMRGIPAVNILGVTYFGLEQVAQLQKR
jgi:hypothetical protein